MIAFAWTGGAMLAASLAVVQVTAPDQPIIIEGQKPPTHKEALRTVTDMTMIVESQIARFHDPVCPLVIGMQRQAAALVEERIRATALELGALVDDTRCEANLLLFIAGDGSQLVQDIRVHHPSWFTGISKPEKQRILNDRPVRAWSVSSARNEDGQKASIRGSGSSAKSMAGRGAGDFFSRVPQVEVWSSSLLQNATRYHLDGSVIVIDSEAVEGMTLRQLADYAVMRGLAKIRVPENAGQMSSILSLFDRPKGQGPRELTAFDRLYLGELYDHLDRKGYERSVFERQRLAKSVSTSR